MFGHGQDWTYGRKIGGRQVRLRLTEMFVLFFKMYYMKISAADHYEQGAAAIEERL